MKITTTPDSAQDHCSDGRHRVRKPYYSHQHWCIPLEWIWVQSHSLPLTKESRAGVINRASRATYMAQLKIISSLPKQSVWMCVRTTEHQQAQRLRKHNGSKHTHTHTPSAFLSVHIQAETKEGQCEGGRRGLEEDDGCHANYWNDHTWSCMTKTNTHTWVIHIPPTL